MPKATTDAGDLAAAATGTGARSPALVTHGFCLSDARWLHAMLDAKENIKIIENRPCRLAPGWYAVSLSQGAYTGVLEEMDFRQRYPEFPGPLAYQGGRAFGLAKIGYSLPQDACKGHRWSSPDYKIANIITAVLPFDRSKPGPSVRGNFGAFPLKESEKKTRACAQFALGAGHLRRTDAEATFARPTSEAKRPKDANAGAPAKRKKAAAVKRPEPSKKPKPAEPAPTQVASPSLRQASLAVV